MAEKITPNVSAIILAAGVGSRMKSNITKQQIEILGRSILEHTLSAFESAESILDITVVTREEEQDFVKKTLQNFKKPYKLVIGGQTRLESARLGFEASPDTAEYVAIHDCARCLITPKDIDRVAEHAYNFGAASATMRVVDTVKKIDKDGFIISTESRDNLRRAATPQVFKRALYRDVISRVTQNCSEITDDNMLFEQRGIKIAAVDTDGENIKVTEPADVLLAESILKRRNPKGGDGVEIRVGHGYDVHKLVSGRKMIIGGVEIPYEKGLLGHSDADVLVHAIMDALLGAAALGDIGKHFPDTSGEFKDISSINLLLRVRALIEEKGYKISNIDATLVLQAPKVARYVEKMRENIAFALSVPTGCINVKATTEEKLGFTGNGDGAAAHAVALIQK